MRTAGVLGCWMFLLVLAAGGAGAEGTSWQAAGVEEGLEQRLIVRVTGQDFRWVIRYPGPDGTHDTPDDVLTERNIHLPARSDVQIDLRSEDYIYSFYVPDYGLLEMAVPDNPYLLALRTRSAETHKLMGSQMCGYAHPELIGDVIVETQATFDAWLAGRAGTGAAP